MRTEIESGTHPADVAKVLKAMVGFLFSALCKRTL